METVEECWKHIKMFFTRSPKDTFWLLQWLTSEPKEFSTAHSGLEGKERYRYCVLWSR